MASDRELKAKYIGELKFWFTKWLTEESSKKIYLLLTGKTGVGKSRLVNSLIGQKVAKEGHEKDPCTKTVECHRSTVAGVEIVVWDSPGLQDGTECESEYVQDMLNKIDEVDLFIYCLKMDDTRLRDEDLKAMKILTEVFGKKLWDNAVIALTFANKVEDPDADDDSPAASKEYFIKDLIKWEEAFRKHLPKAGIDASIVDKIPRIPTGNVRKLMLPDRENWLTEFWAQCYEKMKTGCRVNLLNVNKQRINFMKSLTTDQGMSLCPVGAVSGGNSTSPYRKTGSSTASDNSFTIQGLGGGASTSSYPALDFTPSQIELVENPTWESFKEGVADKWKGVGKGFKLFFGWLFKEI